MITFLRAMDGHDNSTDMTTFAGMDGYDNGMDGMLQRFFWEHVRDYNVFSEHMKGAFRMG